MAFKQAVKRDAKGRVAFVGPAGSGKSFTMLRLARALAGPEGKIAAIDTEHGSLSKYAHTDTCGGEGKCTDGSHFTFDVDELSSFSHESFLESLEQAVAANYAVFCADSISHFWMGKNGALEFVDTRAKKSGDSFSGWKDFRPHERAMIDAIISAPLHVIVTMRTKNEYVTEKNDKGKTIRRKIGLAPVQREGMEYEFDLVGTFDDDNTLVIDKTRCSHYAGKVLAKPVPKDFAPFIEWLKGAPNWTAEPAKPAEPEVPGPLKMIFKELAKPGKVKEALEGGKKQLLEAMPTTGESAYLDILKTHGMEPGKKPTIAQTQAALIEMWETANAVRQAADTNSYHAEDSDVPLNGMPGSLQFDTPTEPELDIPF